MGSPTMDQTDFEITPLQFSLGCSQSSAFGKPCYLAASAIDTATKQFEITPTRRFKLAVTKLTRETGKIELTRAREMEAWPGMSKA
jgi:hypothetical protein